MSARRGERPAGQPSVRKITGQEIDTPKGTRQVDHDAPCPMSCSPSCSYRCPSQRTLDELVVAEDRAERWPPRLEFCHADVPPGTRPATSDDLERLNLTELVARFAFVVRVDDAGAAWIRPGEPLSPGEAA